MQHLCAGIISAQGFIIANAGRQAIMLAQLNTSGYRACAKVNYIDVCNFWVFLVGAAAPMQKDCAQFESRQYKRSGMFRVACHAFDMCRRAAYQAAAGGCQTLYRHSGTPGDSGLRDDIERLQLMIVLTWHCLA